jgi:DNA-binding response OmpR family regulator
MAGSILIVDDDRDIREALVELLTEAGWSVITASGPTEGAAAARANRVDLVLTDVLMPGSDGMALASALRRDPDLATIPIVFMTASLRHVGELEGEVVIPKPFDVSHLLATLRGCLIRT